MSDTGLVRLAGRDAELTSLTTTTNSTGKLTQTVTGFDTNKGKPAENTIAYFAKQLLISMLR
jgi:hypothetical protein